MSGISGANMLSEKLLDTLREMQGESKQLATGGGGEKKAGDSFTDHLMKGIGEVNGMSVSADKMAMEMAAGKTGNIHETMLAATQAELSFNLMVQVRNKALEAYTEVMRMPV